jgi:hypothetical protein
MILKQIPKLNFEKSSPGRDYCRLLYKKSQENLARAERERTEADAAIMQLVRAKFVSGNSISVPRITLDRKEVFKDET